MAVSLLSITELKSLIREIPDFPKPGILFYDITTLLKDAAGLENLLEHLSARYQDDRPDVVVGIEARGFMFGTMLAARLQRGFVPMRKPSKLPADKESVTYDLEYGQDSLEVHRDAIQPGQRVLIVDDLLATGGTAAAAWRLTEKLGGISAGFAFVIELTALNGRNKLPGHDVFSLLKYDR